MPVHIYWLLALLTVALASELRAAAHAQAVDSERQFVRERVNDALRRLLEEYVILSLLLALNLKRSERQ